MRRARAGVPALLPARERTAHWEISAPPERTWPSGHWGPDVFTDEHLTLVEKLIAFAQSRNQTLLDLAFAWLLGEAAGRIRDHRRKQRRTGSAQRLGPGWQLTAENLAEIEQILGA